MALGCYLASPAFFGVDTNREKVPEVGGDTLFANMEAAYAGLTTLLRRRLMGATRYIAEPVKSYTRERCGC